MTHTPGPWKWQYGSSQFSYEVNQDTTGLWSAVADVRANGEGSRTVKAKEAQANARLIAAAPELLRELKFAVSVLQDNHIARGVAAALAAIRKAEGIGE